MVSHKRQETQAQRRPATSPEGRENQIVNLTMDLAERQIRDGTASSQVMTHFLKLASPREKLEREKLAAENEVLRAKVEQLQSAKNVEELYSAALNAMRQYSGQDPIDDEDYDDYDDR
jgi:hypothetical protein